jgi:hypothetical protein
LRLRDLIGFRSGRWRTARQEKSGEQNVKKAGRVIFISGNDFHFLASDFS